MRGRGPLLGALLAALLPGAAQAHLVSTGMGPVYDGLTHFALSPEEVLPVIALGLYAGLRGPAHARLILCILPTAWIVGGVSISLTGWSFGPGPASIATAALLMLIGTLLAADLDLSPRLAALPAGALGLVRGAADLSGAAAGPGAWLGLLGMGASVFAVFALAASVSLPLRRFWMIVAARVTGSWLAAAGLLLAGWIIRYGARVAG